MKKYNRGLNIFAELDSYFKEQKCQQQIQGHLMLKNSHWQPYRMEIGNTNPIAHSRLSFGTAPMLQTPQVQPIRPPSEVIQAACSLVELSSTPRLFPGFQRSQTEFQTQPLFRY